MEFVKFVMISLDKISNQYQTIPKDCIRVFLYIKDKAGRDKVKNTLTEIKLIKDHILTSNAFSANPAR